MRTSTTWRSPSCKTQILAGTALSLLASAVLSPALADEIYVKAQKRSERVEDVPISISAVTAEQLEKQSITEVMFLQQVVPSLRLTRSGTFVQPTIRGIGSQVALPGLPQNITTYVDGYYVPTPAVSNFNLVNAAGVNVLKGPQGTLFGYNTTGGAIQITTQDPQHEPSGMARIGYGRFNHASFAFYGTTGVSEDLAVDLAAAYERGDGYVTNIFTGDEDAGEFDQYYVRSKVLWTPSDNARFTLGFSHSYEDDPRTQNVVARDQFSIAIAVPGAIIPDAPRIIAHDTPGYSRFESTSITLTSEFDLGFATLTSLTGFRKDKVEQGLDYEASSAALNFSHWTVPDETFTQEINLASAEGGRLNWVLGGFYLHTKDDYDYNTNGSSIFDSSNKTQSVAVFFDATYEIADSLFITGGGRYTWDKPEVYSYLYPFDSELIAEASFDDFTARGVIRYEPTESSSIYASFSQGYKAGALPASAFSATPIGPETINGYELGYKVNTGTVMANLAAFYYDYKDIQVTSYGAGGASTTVNAAKAESYGVDGDITWAVTPDFEVNLSASYVHAEYVDFPNATIGSIDDDPMSMTYGTITTSLFDATGSRVERTPRFSGNIGFDYGWDFAGGRMGLNGNVFYSGEYKFDVAGVLTQPEHVLVNLRATWIDPTERWELAAFGTNVTGEEYFRSSFIDPYAARTVYAEPAEWGVSVTAHF